VQCGFCSPGLIVSAKALLDQEPQPTKEAVAACLSAHGGGQAGADSPAAQAVLDAAAILGGSLTKEELWQRAKGEKYAEGAELADARPIARATGIVVFGADLGLQLPAGSLYIKPVRPQQAPAKLFSIDASEAEKVPGVLKVLTAKDVSGTNRLGAASKILEDRAVEGGGIVAAVLAFAPGVASQAAALVKVKSEPAEGGHGGEGHCCCGGGAADPCVSLAYVNERGKLVIHTQRADIDADALAEAVGAAPGKLALERIPCLAPEAQGGAPEIEGIAGVAALLTGKAAYVEA